jgi:hypothetical protein
VTWLPLNIAPTIPASSAVIVDRTNNSIDVTGVSSERDIAYHHCNQVNGQCDEILEDKTDRK